MEKSEKELLIEKENRERKRRERRRMMSRTRRGEGQTLGDKLKEEEKEEKEEKEGKKRGGEIQTLEPQIKGLEEEEEERLRKEEEEEKKKREEEKVRKELKEKSFEVFFWFFLIPSPLFSGCFFFVSFLLPLFFLSLFHLLS